MLILKHLKMAQHASIII